MALARGTFEHLYTNNHAFWIIDPEVNLCGRMKSLSCSFICYWFIASQEIFLFLVLVAIAMMALKQCFWNDLRCICGSTLCPTEQKRWRRENEELGTDGLEKPPAFTGWGFRNLWAFFKRANYRCSNQQGPVASPFSKVYNNSMFLEEDVLGCQYL